MSVQSLSRIRLFVIPWAVACQALCPLGFSRQEYWSGLPGLPPGDLPKPGIEPRSPALQVISSPSEPPGKPKNTGLGSLSLLQGNFLTQESNQGLLLCRQILYQLSYPGSPYMWNLKQEDTDELIHKIEVETQLQKTIEWLPGNKGEGGINSQTGLTCACCYM